MLPAVPEGWLALGSARHPVEAMVQAAPGGFAAKLSRRQPSLPGELTRSFPEAAQGRDPPGATFTLPSEAALARWLRRAAALAQALPAQAMTAFVAQVQAALTEREAAAAKNTEVQRLVRRRVGQQAVRHPMLDYWGGACAVTCMAVPHALRASHAKAWALCVTDTERLDVYNGLLLSANLDALFDAHLTTFLPSGALVMSPAVPAPALVQLGIAPGLHLRWLDERHLPYLAFHRTQCGWLHE